MTSSKILTPLSALMLLTLSLSLARAEPSADTSAQTQSGVWQKHEYNFNYLGFTSTYSCDGLADKLKELLIASGARADAKSQPGACASGFGHPDKFARASLTFYTLAAASASANAAGSEQTAPVAGVWRAVVIEDHRPSDLRIGDCELIEQFRNSVLPMFTTRNLTDHTSCVPHQESGSVIDLHFETFTAAAYRPATRSP